MSVTDGSQEQVARPSAEGGPRWLAQEERPGRLSDVDFAALPVELRLLLVHDGTLTTALEAYRLAPIMADVGEQRPMTLDPAYAGWLDAPVGAEALHRRTLLRQRDTGELLVQAEVVLLLDRLPAGFADILARSTKGLGAAFAQMRVETRRELLWFGRTELTGLTAEDRRTAGTTGTSRGYRLIMGSTPVCCIEEIFPDDVIRGTARAERAVGRGSAL